MSRPHPALRSLCMQRLREMLAHGGVATLAVVFALAFAAFYLANAVAQTAVYVLSQHVGESESGFAPFEFKIFGTEIEYGGLLQATLALAFVATALFGVWRVTRGTVQACPECKSDIPQSASICRYCTTELHGASD